MKDFFYFYLFIFLKSGGN